MNYNKISQKPRHQKEYRQPKEPVIVQSPNKARMGTVISPSRLNVRKEPDVDSEVLTTIEPGYQVEVREVHKDWSYIYVDNTLQGYSMSKYIKINKE